MFGLSGLIIKVCFAGEMITSISSIGTAPRRTSSPRIKAPVKQLRFWNSTNRGPAYGTSCFFPSAVATSLWAALLISSSSWMAICSGIHKWSAPVSTNALTSIPQNLCNQRNRINQWFRQIQMSWTKIRLIKEFSWWKLVFKGGWPKSQFLIKF